jgi:hypothetical protein
MNRRNALALAAASSALAACAPFGADMSKMVTLLDGTNMNDWNRVGDANWRTEDGAVVADKGNGFLVSKKSYKDFHIVAEFWSDAKANSGIFIRCTDAQKITATNSYEVNIFDQRPDISYGTGAIVGVAAVSPMPHAAGRWNTFEITARGPQLWVSFNGSRTVDGVRDARFPSGPFALQYAAGIIKFRKVQIVEI